MGLSKSYLKDLTYKVTGAAIEVHKILGPGLLESVYQQCMEQELKLRNIRFKSEQSVPVIYKGLELGTRLRCDIYVEQAIAVELKAVNEILPIHKAQLITYMNLLDVPQGILINFNVANLYRKGQQTFVNELFRILPD